MKPFSLIFLIILSAGSLFGQTPVITSFNPAAAFPADTITIAGTGFNLTPASNIVMFGNARATVVSSSATVIKALLPIGATSQSISVLNTASNRQAYRNVGVSTKFLCGNNLISTSFAPRQFVGANFNRGYSAANGDLDLDGKADLVFGSYVGGAPPSMIHIMRNTSTGPGNASFTQVDSVLTFGSLYSVGIADIDMDGKPDVIASAAGTSFSVYRNISPAPGTILLAPKVTFTYASTSIWTIGFADMDGDGKTDIFTGSHSTTGCSIFPNTSTPGTISFGAKFTVLVSTPGWANLTDAKSADLDMDGKSDIVFASYNTGAVGIVRNTSTPGAFSFDPGFYLTVPATGQTHGVAVGDLTGDGKPEVFGVHRNLSTSCVWENISTPGVLSTGSFGTRIDLGGAGSTAMIEDISGDGRPDLVFSNGGGIVAFQNKHLSGTLTAASFGTIISWNSYCGGTGRMFTLGDWDGDGKLDLASAQDATPGVGDISLRQTSPGFLAPVGVTRTGITASCDDGTWEYIYDPGDPDKILLAVRDNGLVLGSVTSSAYVDPASYLTFGNENVLRRHYVINPAADPVGTKRVRLYFTQAEFDSLNAHDATISVLADLAVFKYDGPGEDGTFDLTGGVLTTIPPAGITTGSGFGGLFLEFNVSGFSEFWIGSALAPVPLEWISFSGEGVDGNVKLKWEIANDDQGDYFTVLRSLDEVNFESIGNLSVNISEPSGEYEFTDVNAISLGNEYFYQIVFADRNGVESKSQILHIKNGDSPFSLSVCPNPGSDEVQLKFSLDEPGPVSISVHDLAGKVVYASDLGWKEAGALSQGISLGHLTSGLYFIHAQTEKYSVTRRWVRQ